MKAPSILCLVLGAAVLLSGCVGSYYSGDSTYSRMVEGILVPILQDGSEVDQGWTGHVVTSGSTHGPTGYTSYAEWSGDVTCSESGLEQLGQDIFDTLRMDIFARGFEVDADETATFLREYSPGANPAIQMKITHHNGRNKGSVTLTVYPRLGDEYSVKIAFNEESE